MSDVSHQPEQEGGLVGPHDIADRLGVSSAAVSQWKRRGLLPQPVAVVSGVPMWHWTDIEQWALSRTWSRSRGAGPR